MKVKVILAVDSALGKKGASVEVNQADIPQLVADGKIVQPQELSTNESVARSGKAEKVKARVLVDCALGKVNSLALVDSDQVEQLRKDGKIDPSTAAVEYAESLKRAK